MRKIVLVMVLLGIMAGCGGTRSAIRTEPPGATIVVGEKEKVVGKTPLFYDLDDALGFGQALGLGTPELLLRFRLEGYEDEATTVQKGAGSLFEQSRWPSEIFIRLRKKE